NCVLTLPAGKINGTVIEEGLRTVLLDENGFVVGRITSISVPRVAMSKSSAKPPLTAVFPLPATSQAKPTRGLKLCNEGFWNRGPTVGARSCWMSRSDD